MRLIRLIPAALILFMCMPVAAQEWLEYYSKADFFLVNFPGQPQVRNMTYPTEFGLTLPAHLHVYQDGPSRFSVTVVDYTNATQIHADRVKGCAKYPDQCTNQAVAELRGALDYAASRFLTGNGRVTYYGYANSDRIEGRRAQVTNPDKTRTFVAIYMHENRLYILEATVPPTAPPPALFQQSMGFLDKDGERIRYATPYSNAYPAPAREAGGPNRPMGCE